VLPLGFRAFSAAVYLEETGNDLTTISALLPAGTAAEEGAGKADQAATLFADVAGYNFNLVGFALLRKEAMARTAG